jgi:hypothetical protein
MKCIHCGSDTTYPVRSTNGGKCGSCLHPFAFEPKNDTTYSVTDGLFKRLIDDVSANGTLSFTERNLWYELNRRLVGKVPFVPVPYRWGMGASVAGGAILAFTVFPPVGIVAGLAGLITCGALGVKAGKNHPSVRYVRMALAEFLGYLRRYQEVHGPLEKLVRPVAGRPANPLATATMPPDLTAYSFDRALVVGDADTAAMLVANRFHFENNCAILSGDRRYPQNGMFDTILGMLRRNPNLMVFTLHDASVPGLGLSAQMHDPAWFPDLRLRTFDLGLRPAHAIAGKMILQKAPPPALPPDVSARLTPDEVKWLGEGNVAELGAVRPARLMRAIYQGFARANEMATVDDDGAIIFLDTGPGVYVYDGGTGGVSGDAYATDTFG